MATAMTIAGQQSRQPFTSQNTPSFTVQVLSHTGEQHLAKMQGNPTHSTQIRSVFVEYTGQAAELGYAKNFSLMGALPFTQPEMHMLLGSTHELCRMTADQAQKLLLVWHGSLVNLLWQSCFRVFNQWLSNCTSMQCQLETVHAPWMMLVARAKMHIIPDSTKNKKGGTALM